MPKTKRCAVIQCSNDEESNDASFHGCPTDENDQRKWHEFLDIANRKFRWNPTKHMLICSDHFDETCYGSGGNRLLKHSIPTLVEGKILTSYLEETDVKANIIEVCENQMVLKLSTPVEWHEKIIEYAIKLSDCQDQVLLLKNKLSIMEEKYRQKQKDAHVLLQHKRRYEIREEKRKSENVEDFGKIKRIKIMKTTTMSCQTDFLSLQPLTSAENFLQEIANRISHPNTSYSDYLKNLSFTIHFKSPSAYEVLRDALNKALPHFSSFNRWTKHIDAAPGFIQASLDYLIEAIKNSSIILYFALMFDEIYIRKQLLHDGEGYKGYVDYGGLADPEDPSDIATKALFFNLTEINGNKRIPVAYVLTNKLKKESLAQLLTAVLTKLHSVGARVLSMTCDGLCTNLAAIESMGADLNPEKPSFQPWISHPISTQRVYIIIDVCHMYKLLRNLFKATQNIIVSKDQNEETKDEESVEAPNKIISWRYIENLQALQRECGLRAANKLTKKHTSFETQKMKTRLCLQTLSNSVSIAIGVCRDLNIKGFYGSDETQYFLALMNRLFDALNSRSTGKGIHSPLGKRNAHIWQSLFAECKIYLLKLSIMERGKEVRLIDSRKSTAVKGLLITMASFQLMLDDVLLNSEENLEYLPALKFSQDGIELFFSTLRSRFGSNDNPNVLQLSYAVRDIICMKVKDSLTGNCIAQEDTTMKLSPLGSIDGITNGNNAKNFIDENEFEIVVPQLPESNKVFVEVVVVYIAGSVVRKLCAKLSCSSCICLLCPTTVEVDEQYLLIHRRDFGGLCYPSKTVIEICSVVERHVRFWNSKGLHNMKRSTVIQTSINECEKSGLVEGMHCQNQKHDGKEEKHGLHLVKSIMEEYLTARLHHLARESTAKIVPNTNRSTNTSSIHFAGN